MNQRPVIFLLLSALILTGCSSDRQPLVVYCAHDAVFADRVIRDFEQRTGRRVAVKYDTEATKSLGLVELIRAERDRPRADVFWNNELLGTLQLAADGLLAPYQGPGWQRLPPAARDPAGCWTGFAARLRVEIWHRGAENRVGTWSDRATIAKPLFGTTRTHYTVLWRERGGTGLERWHNDLVAQGVRFAAGNAMVKDLVARGICDWGWTDTDDYFEARDNGASVEMRPYRTDTGRTICIPNTVAIVAGTRRPEQARQFVDYLLSAEVEVALARSGSRQVPLGPVDESLLPSEVRDLRRAAADAYPLAELGDAPAACLAWLKAQRFP